MHAVSEASSVRAGALVVLVLAASAIASIEPIRIWLRPYQPDTLEDSMEVETNAYSGGRGHDERVERARGVGRDPAAAHVGAD